MHEENGEIYPIKKGIIVFLDVLGVKGIGIEKSLELIRLRNKVIKSIDDIKEKRINQFENDLNYNYPNPSIVIFQDSIIVCFDENKIDAQCCIFDLAAQWVIDALNCAIWHNLFLRGAMSYGEYIVNTSDNNVTILGPAMDDAHSYYEIADWIGVIMTPTCEEQYSTEIQIYSALFKQSIEEAIKYRQFLFVRYQIPLSKNQKPNEILPEEFRAISWPRLANKQDKEGKGQIIQNLKNALEDPKNKNHISKYKNTLTFAKWYDEKIVIDYTF